MEDREAELPHPAAVVDAGQRVDHLVVDDREPEDDLHEQDGDERMLREPVGHLAQALPRSGPRSTRRGRPRRASASTVHGEKRRKPPQRYSAREDLVRPAAGDGQPLQGVERPLHGAGGRVAAVAGQHGPEPRDRAHGQEVGPQELHDQGRDDLEVERAVAQEVRGGDLLQRGPPVHLLPEEPLGLGDLDDLLGAAVLAGRTVTTPCVRVGQARQLPVPVGDPLGPAVEVRDRARDLADLEAVAVRPDAPAAPGGRASAGPSPSCSRGLAPRAAGATRARRPGPWPRAPSG